MDVALARCDREILLATYAVLTGRDAVNCNFVSLPEALLYLSDWQAERVLLLKQLSRISATPDPSTYPPAVSLLDAFWRHQPCSACVAPCADCPHRLHTFAGFLSLLSPATSTPGS